MTRSLHGKTALVTGGSQGIGDYVASKAALAAYTRAWSHDLGARDITVNIVQPGAVNTDMNPTDGPNVAFLAGPDAGFITGTTVNIDGGLSA